MEKPKILICDDEEVVFESLALILAENYELITASNREEALEKLKANSDIKLTLLDIKMPRINGLEILKEIKSAYSDIPVIMITGYQTTETAAEAIKQGALDYITKPFDPKFVLASVNRAL